jgi:hypothetical protein
MKKNSCKTTSKTTSKYKEDANKPQIHISNERCKTLTLQQSQTLTLQPSQTLTTTVARNNTMDKFFIKTEGPIYNKRRFFPSYQKEIK